jgi:hypothetical protein
MRLIITPRFIALLVACVITFAAVADAHAFYLGILIAIPVLVLDVGLTIANANALRKDDPNFVTGITGFTFGTLITVTGVGAMMGSEGDPNEVAISMLLGVLGAASVVYGWRAMASARRDDNVAQNTREIRLTPILTGGNGNSRRLGLGVEISF